MPVLEKCWTPFLRYSWTNVKYGSYYAATYMVVFHFAFLIYALYVICDGQTTFFGPYFNQDKIGSQAVSIFTIVFSGCLLLFTAVLAYAVKKANRYLFIPWLIGTVLEIFLIIALGVWFIAQYYSNIYSIFTAIVLWCFDGLHIYCLLCVISQYQVLQDSEEPRFHELSW